MEPRRPQLKCTHLWDNNVDRQRKTWKLTTALTERLGHGNSKLDWREQGWEVGGQIIFEMHSQPTTQLVLHTPYITEHCAQSHGQTTEGEIVVPYCSPYSIHLSFLHTAPFLLFIYSRSGTLIKFRTLSLPQLAPVCLLSGPQCPTKMNLTQLKFCTVGENCLATLQ